MSWAVHWFHSEALVVSLENENIFFVVDVMTRCLPKLEIENVWSNDFLKTSDSILKSD
jgi:hypothetical protein